MFSLSKVQSIHITHFAKERDEKWCVEFQNGQPCWMRKRNSFKQDACLVRFFTFQINVASRHTYYDKPILDKESVIQTGDFT